MVKCRMPVVLIVSDADTAGVASAASVMANAPSLAPRFILGLVLRSRRRSASRRTTTARSCPLRPSRRRYAPPMRAVSAAHVARNVSPARKFGNRLFLRVPLSARALRGGGSCEHELAESRARLGYGRD